MLAMLNASHNPHMRANMSHCALISASTPQALDAYTRLGLRVLALAEGDASAVGVKALAAMTQARAQ